MERLLVDTFVLGLVLSAAPGALNVETLRRALSHGFRLAIPVQLGALVGKAIWLALATVAARANVITESAASVLIGLGGICLVWSALRSRPIRAPEVSGSDASPGRRGAFALGAVLALVSPLPATFWVGVQSLVADHLGRALGAGELVMVAGCYLATALIWAVGFTALTAWTRSRVTPRALAVLHVASLAVAVAIGLHLLGTALTRLVP